MSTSEVSLAEPCTVAATPPIMMNDTFADRKAVKIRSKSFIARYVSEALYPHVVVLLQKPATAEEREGVLPVTVSDSLESKFGRYQACMRPPPDRACRSSALSLPCQKIVPVIT